jgi:phage virion morphogenesis protein
MLFKFEFNGAEETKKLFDRMAQRARDFSPAMRSIAFLGENEARKAFDTETAPDGRPWKESWRKKVKGGKTLTDTGRLYDSLTSSFDSNSAEWGTAAIYAGIHQFGGTIVPKSAKKLVFMGSDGFLRFANKVTIPARPFLPKDLSEMDFDAISEILTIHILRK